MSGNNNWKRLVSGALAAQLLCAPAAEALSLDRPVQYPAAYMATGIEKEMPRLTLPRKTKLVASNGTAAVIGGDESKTGTVENGLELEEKQKPSDGEDESTAGGQTAQDPLTGTVTGTEPGGRLEQPDQQDTTSSAGEDADQSGKSEEKKPLASIEGEILESGGQDLSSAASSREEKKDERKQEELTKEEEMLKPPRLEEAGALLDSALFNAGTTRGMTITEGVLTASGQNGLGNRGPHPVGKGVKGYRAEISDEDRSTLVNTTGGWGDWLEVYSTKDVSLPYVTLSQSEAITFNAPMPRLPNYEFGGWYVHKGVEFAETDDLAFAFDYLMKSRWTEEEKVDATDPTVTKGYPFKRTGDGYTLNWTEESTAKALLQHLYDQGLLGVAECNGITFDNVAEAPEDWSIEGYADKYYMLFFSTGWTVSKNATLVGAIGATAGGTARPLYTTETTSVDDIAVLSNSDLINQAIADQPAADDIKTVNDGTTKYFTRVESDVDTLTLSVVTYEPGSLVYVEREFDGKTVQYVPQETVTATTDDAATSIAGTDITRELKNGPQYDTEGTTAQNSLAAPARSEWTLTIPLEQAQGAGALYNELRVVVVPPADRLGADSGAALPEEPQSETIEEAFATLERETDGAIAHTGNEKVYTVYAQRLNEPTLTYGKGNTPAGLIARDSKIAARDKAAVLTRFVANQGWIGLDSEPALADELKFRRVNSKGEFNGGLFSLGVWDAYAGLYDDYRANPDAGDRRMNPDLDDEATVVYLDSAVTLPGIKVMDSLGRQSDGVTATRTLTLREVEKWDPAMILQEAPGSEVVLTDTITVGQPEKLDLKGRKIVPGLYSLEYAYADPTTGEEYNSGTKALFPNDPDIYKTFHRVLMILPIPGDVDMDGVVTVADGVALEKLQATVRDAQPEEKARAGLFLFRVCDVNGNGQCVSTTSDYIDLSDRNMLLQAFGTPLYKSYLGGGASSDYRYWPLDRVDRSNAVLGGSPEAEEPVATVDAGKAGLKLVYLGKGETVPDSEADRKAAVDEGEIFWVGVELENAAKLNETFGKTKAITMTIAVDGEYVSMPDSTIQPDITYWTTSDVGQTPLNYKGRLTAEGDTSGTGLTWRTGNASKAMATFDAIHNAAGWEYQLTVYMQQRSLPLQDGILVKFPLKMEKLPPDDNETNLVELALGMRELCLVGETGGTAAYDCRKGGDVYRGETRNLKDFVEYRACDQIPVGQDVSTSTPLKNEAAGSTGGNIVYGEPFSVTLPGVSASSLTAGTLPKGIEYKGTGRFEGIPEETGTFDGIVLVNKTYSIEVKKAQLTLTVQPNERYYGEALQDVRFTYDPAQLKTMDQKAGLTGKMEELAQVLGEGYVPPVASSWVTEDRSATGTPVTEDSPVPAAGKTYYVAMTGGTSKNYRFNFYREGKEPSVTGWSTLTVHKRPVLVDEIVTDPVYTKSSRSVTLRAPDDASGVLSGHSVTDFTLALPSLTEEKYSHLPKLPLTGDALHTNAETGKPDDLIINYVGMFVAKESDYKEETDSTGVTKKVLSYHMELPVEKRDMTIQDVAFQTGGLMDNYQLLSTVPVVATTVDGGRLLRDYVKRLRLSHIPADASNGGANANDPNVTMKYTHGDRIVMTSFMVDAPTNIDPDGTSVYLAYDAAKALGIEIFWAKMKEENGKKLPDGIRIPAENNMPLSRSAMDGFHLWVHATSYDEVKEEPVELYSYSYSALELAQATLTLRIGAEERYYGEPNTVDNKTSVTYDISELSPADQKDKTGDFWKDFNADNLPGYVAPTVKWVEKFGDNTPVEQNSTAYIDRYYVTLSGAASTDYAFKYVQKKYDGTSTTVDKNAPLYWGCNIFKVHPRPIIVTRINDVVNENGTVTVPREVYADDEVYSFTESAQAGAGTVVVALPVKGQSYKVRGNGEKEDGRYPVRPNDELINLPLTGDPVYTEDKVTVSYQTSYIPDHATGRVHFDLSTDQETRTVELTDVTITDNTNYLLVFTNVENTQYGYPGTATGQTVTAEHQTTGIVRIREITNVVIKQPLPQLSYVHGDSLTLNDVGRVLTVEVSYKNGGTKTFEYVGNTFANAGIHLTWDAPWAKDDPNNKELLTINDMILYRPAHNGHKLYVTVEQLGNLSPAAADPLTVTVDKKSLQLSAVKQYRYFGEENAPYEFSFNTGDLAATDRNVLREWGGGAPLPASLQGAEAVNALQKINEQFTAVAGYVPYESPKLDCEATATSSPGAGEGEGGAYPMTIKGGAMTNYDFTYVPGFVRVFKRPIFISRVTANPVTVLPIESSMTAKQVTLSQSVNAAENDLEIVDLATTAGRYYNRFDADYINNADEFDPEKQGLSLTGNPIVSILREDGTDAGILYVTLTVNFEPRDQREPIPPEVGIRECSVTVSGMALGDGASAANYCLVTNTSDPTTPSDPRATGLYTSRKIKELSMQRQPSLNFQYGDSVEGVFGQSKLRPITFDVSYESAGTVRGMSYNTLQKEVTPELYYWDPAWPIPGADYLTAVDTTGMTTAEAEAAQKAYITQKVTEALADKAEYKITMEEHLSRTPVDKNGVEFAHQGMALLIAVRRQEMEGEDYAVPVLTDATIDITRKNIAYEVTAEDKVYDGGVIASGVLTLKGVYPGDDVQVDTGAIKFNFIDPNVAYVDAAGPHNYGELDTVTVEVSDIRLIGHDEDNYSIDASIDRDYTPTAEGRPSAAPEATIRKAPRPAPVLRDFTLSVDNHTNVLTVTHSGMPEGDSGDQHNGEIHLEYALGHPVSPKGEAAEGTALTAEDFDIEITPWQDGLIFGGEKVGDVQSVPAEDTGFGSRDPLPKDTWFRVDVRIAESWNYLESPSVYSIEKDAFLVQAGLLEPPAGESASAERTAAKTYRYRIDLYTIPEKRDEAAELKEIWFNDVDRYERADDMHVALENEKNVRGYYDYYWDSKKQLPVRFPWNLTIPQTVILGDDKTPITIPEEGNVSLYATTERAASGNYTPPTKRELTVEPTSVQAHLGDKPFQLIAVLMPEEDLQILWSSSDERVVKVDENGLLTFVGVGEAVITVSVQYSKLKATIPVVVLPEDPRPFSPYAGKLLDVYNTEAFMFLDKYLEFHPNWTMNRGEVALIMARLLIEPENEKPGEAIRFNDLTPGDELAQAVDKLSKWGIVNGIPDGGFQADRDITRAEVVVMISRMLRLKKGPETNAFLDAGISVTWAAPYLKELVEADVIRGTGDGYFAPGRIITRAEMAALITRLLTTRADEAGADLKIPSDMDKTHWAYEYALRAVNSNAIFIDTKKE